jgi:hypothetical protein
VKESIPAFTLSGSLPSAVTPATTSAVILSLGIEFYQEVNGLKYLMKQNGCMRVVEVG